MQTIKKNEKVYLGTYEGTSRRFWNKRYAAAEYVYGIAPNDFFKEHLDQLKPGSILLPAEGEGRNAVYAALQGWKVTAFDISKNGGEKALQLSKRTTFP